MCNGGWHRHHHESSPPKDVLPFTPSDTFLNQVYFRRCKACKLSLSIGRWLASRFCDVREANEG